MFTGLIECTGSVLALESRGESAHLVLSVGPLASELTQGESVSVNGCCLTVTEWDVSAQTASFDLLMQTLKVTSLGDLQPGSLVNLERAMSMNARFGGHFVQGHVDATVRILDWSTHGQDHRLEVELAPEHAGLVIPKGSICLDGISLTAAEVTPNSVVCWIIPHTHQVTSLHTKSAGMRLNVEFDLLGKYVRNLMQAHTGN
ncbi:riboflavin synthase alpha chain [Prosthecobacter fusiformis]|uniref:Riboflavin synthase n=1 Tax=Prosthecobacter fusiformis TaxID=48464 RepID=A0A4R7S3U8_9BACT|nr:riboflavin synthase [Prosthecobacter fusiformis]TDU73011.1 riboflavin synthase alpha chain [Prosthecobacter fusiformis]